VNDPADPARIEQKDALADPNTGTRLNDRLTGAPAGGSPDRYSTRSGKCPSCSIENARGVWILAKGAIHCPALRTGHALVRSVRDHRASLPGGGSELGDRENPAR
jgi:hypothetical protein